jgi:GntR family transcriptional regulator, transcriptional repressor for pyruvate dehydrogenase complex
MGPGASVPEHRGAASCLGSYRPDPVTDDRLINVQITAIRAVCGRLTPAQLEDVRRSVERACRLPRSTGWDRKAAAHAEIFGLLAGAVDHPRLARTLNSAMEFVGELMGVAGPATGPLTANSHRRLLAFLLAGNPEGAARELESYLRVLRFMGRLAGGPEPSIAMR